MFSIVKKLVVGTFYRINYENKKLKQNAKLPDFFLISWFCNTSSSYQTVKKLRAPNLPGNIQFIMVKFLPN